MRTPLQTIQLTASYLSALNADAKVSDAASRLINSGARMKALLDDLLDFNQTMLGSGIRLVPSEVDLESVFTQEVDQLRAAFPDRRIDLNVAGDTRGVCDGLRLQQLLSNLVRNAVTYGAPDEPVVVALTGDAAQLLFEVRNRGPAIDRSMLDQIFEPLKRGESQEITPAANGSLGLGLYIAREIAQGHGGAIEARSDESGTVFAVRLPRRSR